MWRLQSSEIWLCIYWYCVTGRLEELLRILPSLQFTCRSHQCCLISAVEASSLNDPQSHRDRTFLSLTEVENGHWFGVMSNSMILVPSTKLISTSQQIHEMVKSFSINWNGASNGQLKYRACWVCSHDTANVFVLCSPSFCRVKGAPYKVTVWEPQPAHATVSSCISFL